MAALRKLGVRCAIGFSAVGSLKEEVRPRDFVVVDQYVDWTKGVSLTPRILEMLVEIVETDSEKIGGRDLVTNDKL